MGNRLDAARALLEQPVGVTEQSSKGDERRGAAHARGHAERGEDAEDIERRKHGEREDIEGAADLRSLADETQRDQRAGDREDVERRAGGALARRLRAGALEREVLGGQSGQELLAIRGLGHLTKVPTAANAAACTLRYTRSSPT